jgi:crotonobetainyl-CoA:carnitine CoA-transferase CaiB-like acyl-CoA transferase
VSGGPLESVRVLDCCLLGPNMMSQQLADLGADVVKVESPAGDYVRQTGWPFIEGNSAIHWHMNRGKRSIIIDLKTPDGQELLLKLAAKADVMLEGMRPGTLERLGLTWAKLQAANPKLVYVSVSGFGSVGPLSNMPTHGFGFDSWAGVAPPRKNADGFDAIPDPHIPVGYTIGPLYAAFGALAGVIRARATGKGCRMEVSQSAAAASFNWMGLEHERAFTKAPGTPGALDADKPINKLPPGAGGLSESVRYQYYPTKDSHVLFMPTERKFWQRFCEGIGRKDIFDAHPGPEFADHARGNTELRKLLTEVFKTRTTWEWLEFALKADLPIAPVNSAKTLMADPHFTASTEWLPAEKVGMDMLPIPIRFPDEKLPVPRKAPKVGEHSEEVKRDWLNL